MDNPVPLKCKPFININNVPVEMQKQTSAEITSFPTTLFKRRIPLETAKRKPSYCDETD